MTYLSKEQSTHDSEPLELYEFTRGAIRYAYTSSDSDITFNSSVYDSVPMDRTNLESSGELGRAGLKIRMPRDTAFLLDYIISPPSEVTTLTIYRKHRGEIDANAVVIWMGRLLSLKWEESIVELSCEPIYTSIVRLGLRRQFSRTCGHVLYGPKCGVNATAYKLSGSVIGIAANVVSVSTGSTNGDNYFSGGYLQWDYQGRKEKKMILRQVGSALTLSGIPTGLLGGDTVEMFPGCDHALTTCNGKFNNKLNYGGQPWIPSKNPFGSIALW